MPTSPSSASEWPGTSPIILTDLFNLASQPERLPWQPFRSGVEIHMLYGNFPGKETTSAPQAAAAALLKYEPGATVPTHEHTGYEHIMVLSGAQRDHQGQHAAGTLVINPPGSQHHIVSEDGCIVLIIWEKPVAIRKEKT